MTAYRFDPKTHTHYWGDKPLTGITEALKVVSKGDAVVQWAVNLAVQAMQEGKSPEEAKRAWRQERQDAADAGTDTHALVEELVKRAIREHGGYLPPLPQDASPQVQEFHRWARTNKVRFHESEKHLWSTTHWIGGICDLLLEMDGKRFVGDVKTGKDIYPEFFLQMAGYRIMLEEMGIKDIHGAIVILLPRKGGIKTAVRYDYETDKEGFLAALRLYRTLQTFANYKK